MYLADLGLTLDNESFEKAMNEQKEMSRKSWKGALDNSDKVFHNIKEKSGETKFVGYEKLEIEATLLDVINLEEMKGLIFDTTSFYGESGGQVGDIGTVKDGKNIIANIYDTQKPIDGLHVHFSKDADALEVGKKYTLSVDTHTRNLITRNHSATHLLQAALIKVLGPHVKQAGSIVNAEKLRFDFAHTQAMSREEIQKVEDIVNNEISRAHHVKANIMNMSEAQKIGAMALFGEKYGNTVRVLSMGDFSTELCGGVHVHSTLDIGLITILSETSLATGVRRIEATTSETAINYLSHRSQLFKKVEGMFMDKEERALSKLDNLFKELKDKQKEIESLKDKIQASEAKDLFNNIEVVGGIELAIVQASAESDLRKLSDLFVNKFPNGAVVLYNLNGDKASVLVRASKGAAKLNAGEILKEILPIINGKGGGKPDLAQGSGEASLVSKIAPQAKLVLKSKLG
jgi:alanyl-tRNA synthetase